MCVEELLGDAPQGWVSPISALKLQQRRKEASRAPSHMSLRSPSASSSTSSEASAAGSFASAAGSFPSASNKLPLAPQLQGPPPKPPHHPWIRLLNVSAIHQQNGSQSTLLRRDFGRLQDEEHNKPARASLPSHGQNHIEPAPTEAVQSMPFLYLATPVRVSTPTGHACILSGCLHCLMKIGHLDVP